MPPPSSTLALLPLLSLAAAAKPNILFIMADQLRADYVTPAFTPHLHALSTRGLTLRNAYTATPSCTPARSALLTGLSPWYNGMLGYGALPLAWPVEMPRAMAELGGFRTASIGKNHYLPDNWPANVTPPSHGWGQQFLYDGLGDGLGSEEFDTYDSWFRGESGGQDPLKSGGLDWNSWRGAPYEYPEAWHPTAWVGRTAAAWLANYSAAEPFFLKVSFHRPHSPYDPPARILNATGADQLPPLVAGGGWDGKYRGPNAWCGPSAADAWCGAMEPAPVELARRAYLSNVKFVDEQVGVVLAQLAASGLAASTWVIFTSDHGDGQGEHHLWRKTFPYEASAHVPGIIAWPAGAPAAATPGSATPLLAELRDIFPVRCGRAARLHPPPPPPHTHTHAHMHTHTPRAPHPSSSLPRARPPLQTVLDIAGIAPPITLNGTSWACLAARDPTGATCGAGGGAWRQALDLEHSTIFNASNHWNALLTGAGLKYIFQATDGGEQLFDLAADPKELTDLSAVPAYAPQLASLRAAMGAQWAAEGRGAEWVGADGLPVARGAAGQTYSPHFPSPPPAPSASPCPPAPPIPGAPCASWYATSGGYVRSCGGPAGNRGSFAGLTPEEAKAVCCEDKGCAGFDFAAGAGGKGSGFYKTNAMGGWLDSAAYVGYYKPGQAPGH